MRRLHHSACWDSRHKRMSPVRLLLVPVALLLWSAHTHAEQSDSLVTYMDMVVNMTRRHMRLTGGIVEDVKLMRRSLEQMEQRIDTLEGTVACIVDKFEVRMENQTGCVEYASPVPEIKALNWNPGPWLNVFSSYHIKAAGRLARWKYFAMQAGVVYLDIWRKRNDGQLELVGYNRVVCEGPGYWEYAVPCDEQILVQGGDMFGVHYPKSAKALDQGVVYYEDSRNPPTFAENSKWLSSVVNLELFAESLTEGYTISDDSIAYTRTVALGADIYC